MTGFTVVSYAIRRVAISDWFMVNASYFIYVGFSAHMINNTPRLYKERGSF